MLRPSACLARVVSSILCLLTACGSPVPQPSSVPKDRGELRLGETSSATLVPGRATRFDLPLHAGEAVALRVEQGVDLEVRIVDGRGQAIWRFDGPYGSSVAEHVCFVARREGRYSVLLEPFGQQGDEARVHWLRRRAATPEDRLCAAAAVRFMDLEARRFERGMSSELAAGYEEIHDDWARAGEALLAGVALRQAGIVRRRLGDAEAAEALYRRALVWVRRGKNAYLEMSLLNDLGQVHRDRHQPAKAREAFEAAHKLATAVGDHRLQAISLGSLALVDEQQGHLHRAVDRLRQALTLQARVAKDQEYAQLQINLARVYSSMGDPSRARPLLTQAREIARTAGDARREAIALSAIGWTHYHGGQPERGVGFLKQALALRRQQGDRLSQMGVLNRLGTVLAASGQRAEALEAFEDSLAISSAAGLTVDSAFTTMNLACLYARLDRVAEAVEALARARPAIESTGDPRGLSYLEYCQALAHRERGEPEAAMAAIERAQAQVESMHDMARRRGERFDPVWLWQDFAELRLHLQLEVASRSGDGVLERRAFEFIDWARSRRWLELVSEGRLGLRRHAPEELLDRERQIQQRLNEEAAKRHGSGSGAKSAASDAMDERLAKLTLDLQHARAAIRAASLGDVGSPEIVRVETLRRQFDERTTLLRYVLTQEAGYLFVVGKDHWRVWALDAAPVLTPQIQMYYQGLRNSFADPLQPGLAASFLSRALLPQGAIPEGTERLLIVADGMLHYLPFATLTLPGSPTTSLLDAFEIQYLPAAGLLASGGEAERSGPTTVAVFADAVYSARDSRLTGVPVPRCGGETRRDVGIERLPDGPLPSLPCTRREARHLEDLVGPEHSLMATGFGANKTAVLGGLLDSYRILHFATHAFIDETFPELSGLVLSRLDAEGRPISGDLYLHEIYALKLNANLVTLSGCQTALGRLVRGNGLISLARGFLHAGSRRVLVSLWSVHDEATSELMNRFYDAVIVEQQAPAVALRSAQLWMRRQERWQAPYYWAAFVLQGALEESSATRSRKSIGLELTP